MAQISCLFDSCYQAVTLPHYLIRFLGIPIAQRARGLSQGNLPNYYWPYQGSGLESRFSHGLGVSHLLYQILKNNRMEDEDFASSVIIAGLMHDFPGPPFAHMLEGLQKAVFGEYGEHRLHAYFDKSLLKMFKDVGARPDLILELVAGTHKPISDLVSGSLDADNADNLFRVGSKLPIGGIRYDPEKLVKGFKFYGKSWCYDQALIDQVLGWQLSRFDVYTHLQEDVMLSPHSMLYRAVEFAFVESELSKEFFELTDREAINHLHHVRNPSTLKILHQLDEKTPFVSVFKQDTKTPPQVLETYNNSWEGRYILAQAVAHQMSLDPSDVCVRAAWGRETRKVELGLCKVDPEKGPESVKGDLPQADLSSRFRIRVYASRKAVEDNNLAALSSAAEEYFYAL